MIGELQKDGFTKTPAVPGCGRIVQMPFQLLLIES
jgi:hypothetical protein